MKSAKQYLDERIPRGFIEFAADSEMPFHNEALQKDAEIYLVCGLGGQAALAGKTKALPRHKRFGFTLVILHARPKLCFSVKTQGRMKA